MCSDIKAEDKNVLGGSLEICCTDPMTGFYRNGKCETGTSDRGAHVVCAKVSEAFLSYSADCGNDLRTAVPAYGFPGLKPGDRWCLCAARWKQAYEAGVAPPVFLEATHQRALQLIDIEILMEYAVQ